MSNLINVKNKRLKISPKGIITLPVAARRSLGMQPGEGSTVEISTEDRAVVLQSSKAKEASRISKGGMLQLASQARELILNGKNRHYWLEANDDKGTVTLFPY